MILKRLIRLGLIPQCFGFRNCARNMCDSSPCVKFEEILDTGIITLNRPKALNALNLKMIRMIYPKLKEWEKKKMFVLMKGSGNKSFCAGGDVLSVTDAGRKGDMLTQDFFREEYRLNNLIGTYQIPFIAVIDGITMGGGVGLSVHGLYRIATERTVFAMPETAIGLFPDVGGTYFLPRLGGNLGMFLALTGYRLKGSDVVRAGVATHACDSDRVASLEKSLLELRSPYPEDIANVIQDFNDSSTFNRGEKFSLDPVIAQINRCFAGGSVEEIIKRLHEEDTDWSREQVAVIGKMSPTSLKITFEALRRGEYSTLQECLRTEYRLTQRCCEDHDFYEGVRAVLIDRDNRPKWKPDLLSEVTEQTVEKYFAPLNGQDELTL